MKYYSNEIVFRGHPDKVCDQISDALLDSFLKKDKLSRCGIEVMGGKGKIFITGEVTSNANVNVEKVVKRVLKDVGYNPDIEVINNLGIQSKDIALGTNEENFGAGDNGMMFGYATSETKEYLPIPVVILQKLSRKYDSLRKKDKRFLPDGKAQITGIYESGRIIGIKDFTICYQNTEENRKETDEIIKSICEDILKKYNLKVERYLINPTGRFLIGGFNGDAGLTGRKIVVDSYQGFCEVGGGAFSGKDPTKVDRSGAYKARELAKRYLIENHNSFCKVILSYAIGIQTPLSITIITENGEEYVPESMYEECKPKNIINDLNLRNIKYEELSKFGHFTN